MAKRDSGPVSDDVLFQSAVSIYCSTAPSKFSQKLFEAKFKEIYAAVRRISDELATSASPKVDPPKPKPRQKRKADEPVSPLKT